MKVESKISEKVEGLEKNNGNSVVTDSANDLRMDICDKDDKKDVDFEVKETQKENLTEDESGSDRRDGELMALTVGGVCDAGKTLQVHGEKASLALPYDGEKASLALPYDGEKASLALPYDGEKASLALPYDGIITLEQLRPKKKVTSSSSSSSSSSNNNKGEVEGEDKFISSNNSSLQVAEPELIVELDNDVNDDSKDANSLWFPLVALSVHKGMYVPQQTKTKITYQEKEIKTFETFYWNRFSQKIQRFRPEGPSSCRGGILADEMGMGKNHQQSLQKAVKL